VPPTGGEVYYTFDYIDSRARQPVEPAANIAGHRSVDVREDEITTTCLRALFERLHQRVRRRLIGYDIITYGRGPKGPQPIGQLAFSSKSFATGGKNTHLRVGLQKLFGYNRHGIDNVFAAIEHDQGALVS
jgi:hypothetical protein